MAVCSQDSGELSTEQQPNLMAASRLPPLHPCSTMMEDAVQRMRQRY